VIRALINVALLTAFASVYAAYWKGHNDGADTALCVVAAEIDGPETFHSNAACRAAKASWAPYLLGGNPANWGAR
jgi:hypothetical protein